MKNYIFTSVTFFIMSLFSYGQTVVWHESFEISSGITSTGCTRTNVNTLATTNCIPTNWKTGRLASNGSNQGHRWRVTGDWPMPGYGSYALDLDMGAAEGGGLLSHGATLTAGISYTLTFYYRVPGTTGGGTYTLFVGHTTNGNQSSNPTTQVASTGNTNTTWNLATYSFTPATTGTYYMQIYGRNTTAASQRLLIDNMTLTQACTVPDQPSAIAGAVTLCHGDSETYSVTNDPAATSYTWTLPSGFTGTSATNSISAIAGVTGGTISVTANNACGSSIARSVNVTVNNAPALPSVISGATNVCENTATTYTVVNNPSATDYTWTLPSGWSGTSTTNSIPATAGVTGGNISVVASNACGSSSSQTVVVTVVNNVPVQPSSITGGTNVCAGTNETYSVTNDPGATSYTWTLPSGFTGTSATNSISVTAGVTGGIISVTADNVCGSSTAQTVSVTVNDVPGQPSAITGEPIVCAGTNETYSVTNDAAATSYTWTLPSGFTGTSTTNSISATAGVTGGTISVTANNVCGSSVAQTFSVTVNDVPGQPSVILGDANVCAGTNETYSVTNDAAATSYTWTLPSGFTGTSTTNSISATAGVTGGTISVTANNACGSSTVQTFSVTVNDIPVQPSVIAGAVTICNGDSETYSVINDPAATSYTWTLPSGFTGTSATNSISATAGVTGGTISVTANNACGSSTAQTFSVTVNDVPGQPSVITGETTVCVGATETYSVINDPGATSYTWTLPSGWNGTSTTNSISTTAGVTGGVISVTANNACGSSTVQTVSITISAINNTVSQSGITLTSNENGASYQWFDCTSGLDIQGATSQQFTPTVNGTYGVHITKGNCTETSACTTINNLGLDKNNLITEITVYPNPANEITIIRLNSAVDLGASALQITDLTGRVVVNQTIQIHQGEHTITVNTSELSHGMYNIELVMSNSILPIQKLMIAK